MRRLLLFSMILSFAGTVAAQIQRRSILTVVHNSNSDLPVALRDTLIQRKEDMKKNWLPYNGMPNAITTKPLPEIYLGNNERGLDLYSSPLDNMGIVKPDSSFGSDNMLVEKKGSRGVIVIPGTSMRKLHEWQKRSDSMFQKPSQPRYLPNLKKLSGPIF